MVQMKDAGALSFGCPITTFISHMVQMKVELRKPVNLMNKTFISHMVQMKAADISISLNLITEPLYIPHGSDESESIELSDDSGTKLYIPHGSDESYGATLEFVPAETLYIPHGSDERMF